MFSCFLLQFQLQLLHQNSWCCQYGTFLKLYLLYAVSLFGNNARALIIFVSSLDLMREVFPGTQLPSKLTCLLVVFQRLEGHSYQNFSALKCHILWVKISSLLYTITKSFFDIIFPELIAFSLFLLLKLLDEITFVDTPGVLSGEKQRTQRSYDFTGVISWFAAKCDLILLLFDPHKLDISDEFKRVIGSLRGHDDKIRVVLNKADQVDTQQVKYALILWYVFSASLCTLTLSIYISTVLQLMRVYGALMWSLGKVLNTPEVSRVYIG